MTVIMMMIIIVCVSEGRGKVKSHGELSGQCRMSQFQFDICKQVEISEGRNQMSLEALNKISESSSFIFLNLQ